MPVSISAPRPLVGGDHRPEIHLPSTSPPRAFPPVPPPPKRSSLDPNPDIDSVADLTPRLLRRSPNEIPPPEPIPIPSPLPPRSSSVAGHRYRRQSTVPGDSSNRLQRRASSVGHPSPSISPEVYTRPSTSMSNRPGAASSHNYHPTNRPSTSIGHRPSASMSNRPGSAAGSYRSSGATGHRPSGSGDFDALKRLPGVRRLVRRMSRPKIRDDVDAEEMMDEATSPGFSSPYATPTLHLAQLGSPQHGPSPLATPRRTLLRTPRSTASQIAASTPGNAAAVTTEHLEPTPKLTRRASWLSRLALRKKQAASATSSSASTPKATPGRTGRSLMHRKSRDCLKKGEHGLKHKRSAQSLRGFHASESPVPPVPALPATLSRPTSHVMPGRVSVEAHAAEPDLYEMGAPTYTALGVTGMDFTLAQIQLGTDLPPFPQELVDAFALDPTDVRAGHYFRGVDGPRDEYPPRPASTTFPAAIADTSPTVPKTPHRKRGSSLDRTFNFSTAQKQASLRSARLQSLESTVKLKELPPTPSSTPPKPFSIRKDNSPPNSSPTRIPAPKLKLSISPISTFNVSAFDDDTPTKPRARKTSAEPKAKKASPPRTKAGPKEANGVNPFLTTRPKVASKSGMDAPDNSIELMEAAASDTAAEATITDATPVAKSRDPVNKRFSTASPGEGPTQEQWDPTVSPSNSFAFSDQNGSYLSHDTPSSGVELYDETFTPSDGSFMGGEGDGGMAYYDPRSLSTIAEASREEFSRTYFDSYLQNGKRGSKMAAPPPSFPTSKPTAAPSSQPTLVSNDATPVAGDAPSPNGDGDSTRLSLNKDVSKEDYLRVLVSQDIHITELGDKIRQLEALVAALKVREGDSRIIAKEVDSFTGDVSVVVIGAEPIETSSGELSVNAKTVDSFKGEISGIRNVLTDETVHISEMDYDVSNPSVYSAQDASVQDASGHETYDLTAQLRDTRQELNDAQADMEALRLELRQATKRYDGVCRQWDKDRQTSKDECEEAHRRADGLERQIRDLKLNGAALSSLMAQSQQATLAQLQELTITAPSLSPLPSLPPISESSDMSLEPLSSIEPASYLNQTTLDIALLDELSILRETCASQTARLESLARRDASVDSFKADRAQLSSQISALEADLAAALLAKETALAKAATFESRTQSLLSKVEELTTAVTLSRVRVRVLEASSADDTLRIHALETAKSRLEEDNDELRAQVASLEAELTLREPLRTPRRMPSKKAETPRTGKKAPETPSRSSAKMAETPSRSKKTITPVASTKQPAARRPAPTSGLKPTASTGALSKSKAEATISGTTTDLRRAASTLTAPTAASSARALGSVPRSIPPAVAQGAFARRRSALFQQA